MKIDPDPWLASVFWHDVFRVVPEGTDTASLQHHLRAREGRAAFYYAKVATARIDQVQALARLGFGVVDVNVTFEREPGTELDGPTLPVRDARREDHARLLDIAAT